LCLFFFGADAALYRQSFDADKVTNGTRNTILRDGACINGGAVVVNGTLVMGGLDSGFHAPALSGSSLGWSVSYSARLIGGATPSDGAWLLWGNAFNITTNHAFNGLTNNPNFSFLAWLIDLFANPNGTDAGFFVVARSGVRTASLAAETLPPNQEVNANVFVAWNQEHGATFRTTGFATNVNFTDVPIEHVGNDSHTWSFATRNIIRFAAIDNIVVDAPCGDCQAGGAECVWHTGGQFERRLPSALQFLLANQTVGHGFSTVALGTEFTVYSAIDIYAIGLLDADARGVNGTLAASIFDRSTDRAIIGSVTVGVVKRAPMTRIRLCSRWCQRRACSPASTASCQSALRATGTSAQSAHQTRWLQVTATRWVSRRR
jgi:hypothetical protein